MHLAVRLLAEADARLVLDGLDDAARSEVDVRVIGPVRPQRSPTPDGAAAAHPPAGARAVDRPPGGHRRARWAASSAGRAPTACWCCPTTTCWPTATRATEGDPALQPGPADGGTDADRIGTLTAFQRFVATGNLVDAAVAALDDGVDADPTGYPGGALLAQVLSAEDVDPDEAVEKVGRTTGHTRGRITAVEVDGVGVQYDEGVVHTFDDQIEIEGADRCVQRRRRLRVGHLAQQRPGSPGPAVRRVDPGRQQRRRASPSPTRWPPCCRCWA